MCEQCNRDLLAAAQAASLLASAAKDLYDINQHNESKTLAVAAAELFSSVKSDVPSGRYNTEPAETPAEPEKAEPGKKSGSKLPQGFTISDDGIMYINGAAIGRVVVIGPTKH